MENMGDFSEKGSSLDVYEIAVAALPQRTAPDLRHLVADLSNTPGFRGDNTKWLARLVDAYARTGRPDFTVGTAPGKARKYVSVALNYVHRCNFVPFGTILGQGGNRRELRRAHDWAGW